MNILVTGANGQLGSEMRLVSAETSDRYVFTDVVDIPGVETVKLDITDLDAVRAAVKEYQVDAIVNCAAYTNVDKAETDRQLCSLLNAKAPENLAVAMKEAGGLLVHISTDYVFGGDPYNTPCTEDRTGTPTGVYGQTKLEGEKAIQTVGCDHVIIRTAWLYSEFGRNFVKTMLSLTATRESLNVVFDQTGTPTYALDLARAIAVVLADYKEFLCRSKRTLCHSERSRGISTNSNASRMPQRSPRGPQAHRPPRIPQPYRRGHNVRAALADRHPRNPQDADPRPPAQARRERCDRQIYGRFRGLYEHKRL